MDVTESNVPRQGVLRRPAYIPVILTLCLGVGVSVATFATTRKYEHVTARRDFERTAGNLGKVLERQIAHHLEVLHFIRAFYEGSREVERNEFAAFVSSTIQGHHHHQAIEWIPRVPTAEIEALEQRVRSEGFRQFRIHPTTERDEHFPVDFVVPYEGNEKAHGYDLASNPARRRAMEAARDSGEAAVTPPIRLVQEAGEQQGLLAFLPVYGNGLPRGTIEERRESLRGFIVAVLRMEDFVAAAFKGMDIAQVHIVLTDMTATSGSAEPLYRCHPKEYTDQTVPDGSVHQPESAGVAGVGLHRTLNVGGRRWSLMCHPARDYWSARTTYVPYALFGAGILITLLLVRHQASLIGRNARIDQLVTQRTAELAEANRTLREQVAEREKAEETLERNLRHQTSLNRLLQVDLVSATNLDEKLQKITDTVVEGFDADFCRIWVTQEGDLCDSGCVHASATEGPHVCQQRDRCLRLAASSGRYTHIDGEVHRRVPFGCYKIGRVAAGSDPKFLTNDVTHDPRVHNHAWAGELGLVSFAGYRLLSSTGKPIGVLALFAKHAISPSEDALVESIATSSSQIIQTVLAEEALKASLNYLDELVVERTTELALANRDLKLEVAERKKAENALQEERNLLRSLVDLLETMDVGITIQDREYNITYQNSFMQKNFGGLGCKCYEVYEKQRKVCDGCPMAKAFEDGQPHAAERTTPAPGGGVYYWDNTAHPIRDTSGTVTSCFEVVRNVTKRKESEEALRRERDFAESLIETAQAIVLVLDTEGRIVRFNRYLEELTGYRLDEVQGKDWFTTFLPESDWNSIRGVFTQAVGGIQTRGNVNPIIAKDGRRYEIEWYDKPLRRADGTVFGILAIGQNVTERRAMESQLVQAQKLESIGQLAAGIAHEINTPTQFVGDNIRFLQDAFKDLQALLGGYTELLTASREGCAAPELVAEVDKAIEEADVGYLMAEVPKAIEQSLEGVERVAKIVRSMKEFSHPGGQEVRAVDLNKAIESTLTVARNEWKYLAETVMDFDASLPSVPCLLGDFNQVILNIIVNAAHAIKGVVGDNTGRKGTITIATRREDDWAEIRISDTGTGIPAEIRHKVFDPFFTTKEVGKGTGQGLAIAHNVIVKKHGGSIDVESEVGRGTTFIIRLPIEPKPAEEPGIACHEEANSLR